MSRGNCRMMKIYIEMIIVEWCNKLCLWMTGNTDDVSCLGWRVNDEVGYVVSRS